MCLEIINLIVLIFTLIVLIWYTVETHRIANQTIETSLRPIILRTGWISDWKKIQPIGYIESSENLSFIEFENLKNIAKDIEGYIIIDDKKHKLFFGNSITQENIGAKSEVKLNLLPKWGWLPINGRIHASFKREEFTETTEKNQIYLSYQDIEGNSYFTKEDSDFRQTSQKSKFNLTLIL